METRKGHKENKLKPEKEKVEREKEKLEREKEKLEREKEELKLEKEQLNLTIENLRHQRDEIRAKIEKKTNKIELARHNKAITELSAEIDDNLKQRERIIADMGLINYRLAGKDNILDKISLKILDLSEERPSKKSKISETKFKGPKELSVTVLRVTSDHIKDRTITGDVYSHWFAVGMYDLRKRLEKMGDLYNESQLPLPLLEDKMMTLEVSRLKRLMEFRKIMFQGNYELPMTSGLAVALDHFLFACQPGQYPKGFCCHQMPITNETTERPDITVFPYPKECFDHTEFVTISDVKVETDEESKMKSIAYALKQQGLKIDKIRLVVAMTKKGFSLHIHVPVTGYVLYIDICKDSDSSLKVFFCMLYAGVHYLLNHPIRSIMVPQPLKDLEVSAMYRPHVLVSKGFVYKLYDTEKGKPQVDIAKLVLHEAEVENLSEDRRYCLLKYQHREENGSPNQKAFKQILSQLHKIHEIGYVHSDIRKENIVFGKEEAWIIDFDLAGKEDERYPYGYNHRTIKERHPKAISGAQRRKIHDVHALDVIMRTHKFSGILEQYEHGTSLLDIAESVTEAMEVEN